MNDRNEQHNGQQPPPGVVVPPGCEYITVGQMPMEFVCGILIRAFTEYSVALGLDRNGYFPLGTGVLVQRRGHYGILTAHHCLHACSPEVRLGSRDGDTLRLVLNRGRMVRIKPEEIIEHRLVRPATEMYGPDLTFIEILALERLGTIKSVGSFWSLDKEFSEIMQLYGKPLTPIATAGYPGIHYNVTRDGNVIRHQIKHMVYENAIKEGDIFQKDGWDYLDTTIWYPGDPNLPASFAGVSGGPVWGMELGRNNESGKIEIRKYALIGVTFYEIYRSGDEGRLRAHFIKSIYDLAWRNFE